ncbi:MMPL family transporter [Streptomyces sp. NPDC048527]|uniref:MMPL family transporter n=1 Tax=Streptomyces sp. NPDC048527 TaxID=3365568 RepID=UPI003722FB7C
MRSLVTLAQRWPRRVLYFGGLLVVVGAALAAVVQPRLTASLGDYDDPGSPLVAAQERMLRATGADPEQGYVVLVRSKRRLDAEQPPPEVVTQTTRLLRARPEVAEVRDYASADDPSMISRDGRQTYVVASVGHVDEKKAVDALRSAVHADPLLRDSVVLGGPTVGNVETAEISTEDLGTAEMFAMPLLVIGLLLVFRGVVAAAIPLLGAVFCILTTFIGLGTAMLFMDVSVFAMNLVMALGMGLAVDFSLLVVSRFRQELDAGAPPRAAVERTVRTAGRTVLFSAATVTVSMACLAVFPQRFLYSMGLAGATVAVAAAFFALVILPALLVRLGPRVNALAPRRLRHRDSTVEQSRWYRIAQTVLRRPLVFAATVTVVLLAAGAPFLKATFSGYDAGVLPASSATGTVHAAMDDFEDATVSPVTLSVGAGASAQDGMARYASTLRQVKGVEAVGAPRALPGGLWIVEAELADPPLSGEARHTLRALESVPAPGSVSALGETARFDSLLHSLRDRLPYVVGIMFALSALVLLLMTGSVVLALKNIVMNSLTIAASFGILVAVFQWGWLGVEANGSLEVTSLIIAGVLISALSTDYGVFLLDRIQEERAVGRTDAEAVAVGIGATGPVVSAAAALLFVPLVAMTTSQLQPIRELGLGAALAVLIDATVVRGALVPALMALLGRWNWAAPRPLRTLHTRVVRGLAAQKS